MHSRFKSASVRNANPCAPNRRACAARPAVATRYDLIARIVAKTGDKSHWALLDERDFEAAWQAKKAGIRNG